jgi:hypothetical protein
MPYDGGNCGSFAIGLAKFLGEEKCQYVIFENKDNEIVHATVKYKKEIFDGDGMQDIEAQLEVWEEASGEKITVSEEPADEHVIDWILGATESTKHKVTYLQWENFLIKQYKKWKGKNV